MTKKQFIYDLIDNYLYYVNLDNVVMENYTCKERTSRSISEAIEELRKFLSYYDELEKAVNLGEVDEGLANANLEYIISCLSNAEKNKLISDIKKCSCEYINEVDVFLRDNLLYNKKGEEQAISKDVIEKYMFTLREQEQEELLKREC